MFLHPSKIRFRAVVPLALELPLVYATICDQKPVLLPTLPFPNPFHWQDVSFIVANWKIHSQADEYTRFRFPFIWGSGKTAVADGTHFELYENNLLGDRHIRYGGYGGIAYHHISNTYVALFSHFIACGVWETVYILDGFLKNKSMLQPDTVHADTHKFLGVSRISPL